MHTSSIQLVSIGYMKSKSSVIECNDDYSTKLISTAQFIKLIDNIQ